MIAETQTIGVFFFRSQEERLHMAVAVRVDGNGPVALLGMLDSDIADADACLLGRWKQLMHDVLRSSLMHQAPEKGSMRIVEMPLGLAARRAS